MTHTQTVMLRLLTMCIPFRNLRKKWRTFLRDFLSDYDRDARRSMRAWRRHPVAGRTILILEPNYCHGEVIPGFCRHHIIANRTFSWWAAWLNEHAEKIVIAPRIWFNREEGDRYHTDDALIPGSWLRI